MQEIIVDKVYQVEGNPEIHTFESLDRLFRFRERRKEVILRMEHGEKYTFGSWNTIICNHINPRETVFSEFSNDDSWLNEYPDGYLGRNPQQDCDKIWFLHPHLSHSYLFGDGKALSNIRWFEENVDMSSEYFRERKGMDQYHSILVRRDCSDTAIINILKALFDYPIISEETWTEVSQELIEQAYPSEADTFKRDLAGHYPDIDFFWVDDEDIVLAVQSLREYAPYPEKGYVHFPALSAIQAKEVVGNLFKIQSLKS